MAWFPVGGVEGQCVQQNGAGVSFEQLPCLYPNTLGRFYTRTEMNYDPVIARDWMVNNPWVPILAILLYGVGCTMGRQFFRERTAWNWRRTMALWNLGLSTFSFLGFLRTSPQLLHNILHYTIADNLCFDPESSFGSGSTGLWVQLFCLSKIPELIDTFFIVVHKKPLIFLHWYHHVSVLLYCWHAFVTKAPAGLIFVVMNYAVHALMYFYYFLMAVKCKPKWFNSIWITVAQISQMIVGVITTALGFIMVPKYSGACFLTSDNNAAALIMYGSYLILFLQFFLKRYSVPVKTHKSMKQA
mmetsp:Transcript_15061/g.41698  ORF Transcript_15061/g.41698 Transcript_15061/m.41698 type:complete len:300 (-) Transcript_15061:384-1283(-)|eukprot:CAMPEP_0198115784 /NCGR_PEP_ID=MMETSP1442-20131203/7214_1 /TAXON_ID= /ORGANISM="Craspedostauros australis, Strain CCMP3328" /LENGTH=299 /DNA_ID=CAMNT_0043773359 /DNA_START=38 /DNA_END=937 /DNA_ORIENTATION=-